MMPDGGRQRTARRVGEAFARREDRLFADDARALHLLQPAVGVGDAPVAMHELHGPRSMVLDADRIGPEPAAGLGFRAVRHEFGFDGDLDFVCGLGVHGRQNAQSPPARRARRRVIRAQQAAAGRRARAPRRDEARFGGCMNDAAVTIRQAKVEDAEAALDAGAPLHRRIVPRGSSGRPADAGRLARQQDPQEHAGVDHHDRLGHGAGRARGPAGRRRRLHRRGRPDPALRVRPRTDSRASARPCSPNASGGRRRCACPCCG